MKNRVMSAIDTMNAPAHRLGSVGGCGPTTSCAGMAPRPAGAMAESLEGRRLLSGSFTFSTLASFNDVNGAVPESGVTLDGTGNLYGTTYFGGIVNGGTVFEIPKGSNTITTLASFDGSNGVYPTGPVTFDADGNLYGTTEGDRGGHLGTVFEIPKGGALVTLGTFNGDNGSDPVARLTLDPAGNLYGTTEFGGIGFSGGQTGAGTVFEIVKGSQTVTTLVSFDGTNGSNPYSGVTLDADGNLYGTTLHGGENDLGTVFEIAKGSNTPTTLVSFNDTNGEYPSDLTMDTDGNLYGTTFGIGFGGGDNAGNVFEIKKGSTEITTLATFDGVNGRNPSGLTLDADGNLYGTTGQGGPSYPSGWGTVFTISKGSSTITTLASFITYGGPRGRVMLDADGNLYGTTFGEGANNRGSVFKLSRRTPGDANADGKVDFADLLILAQNYGKTSATFAQGDFDGNGSVGFPDLLILAQNYGRGTAPTILAGTLLTRSKHARRLVR